MEHQSFQEAMRSRNNGSNGDEGRNVQQVDLTLKLGLPNEDNNNSNQSHIRQHVHPFLATSHLSNFNFSGPYTHHHQVQEVSSNIREGEGSINTESGNLVNYGMMVNEGQFATNNYTEYNPNAGSSFNFNFNGWRRSSSSSSSAGYMNSSGTMNIIENNNYSSGEVVGIPAYPLTRHQYYNDGNLNFSPNVNNMNEYIILDRCGNNNNNSQQTIGSSSSSSSSSSTVSRRRRPGSCSNSNSNNNYDPNKRCTNYNCNTNDTPMWRKGPLGPKTLCNACGIKYRKEGEKRRAKEAATNSNGNG